MDSTLHELHVSGGLLVLMEEAITHSEEPLHEQLPVETWVEKGLVCTSFREGKKL